MAEVTVLPIIASLVYLAVTIYKKVFTDEKHMRWIPAIAGLGGVALGLAMFFATPELINCDNAFYAALIGGASGLAATGANQIFKQTAKTIADDALSKNGDTSDAE